MGDAVSKYARPSDDAYQTATLSMTSADSAYPVTNSQGQFPAETAKSTGTSTTITITLTGVFQILMVGIYNTNATSGTVASGAGLSQPFVFPARWFSGLLKNGWLNLEGIANNTDNDWTIALSKSGSEKLEFGRIVMATAKRDLEWKWEGKRAKERPGTQRKLTRLGGLNRTFGFTQCHKFSGTADRKTMADDWKILEDQCNGAGYGFMLVPDAAVNESYFCLPEEDELSWEITRPDVETMEIKITEINMGRPPSAA